jgi:putative ABC transport system substrate-binding protein
MKQNARAALVALLSASLASVAVPTFSKAQTSKQSLHIGLIAYGEGAMGPHLYRSLIEGLRKQGYIEGRNLVVERRYADAHFERVGAIAKELADLKLDAILTTCTPTTRAMRAVSQGTPLVMAAVSDPVGQGLISSFSHPGGNITGTASQFEDLMAKMLGQFREAVPQVTSMAIIHNPKNPVHKSFLANIEAAARSTSVTLAPFAISRPDDVAPAFDGIKSGGMGAVLVLPDDPVLFNMRRLIVEQLTAQRLPSYFGIREAVEDGGFMSYGESLRHSYFRTAYYLDQIAKGVKPETLPVEQPTKFELVINLKTAKALGLAVPNTLLAAADEVIE